MNSLMLPGLTLVPAERVEVEEEASRLLAFLAPGARDRGHRFID